MALLSARRKTSQTFEITGRALKRKVYWKSDSRERQKQRDIPDPHGKEAQTTQGPSLEKGDLQTCHKGRRCRKLEERKWKLALKRRQSKKKRLTLR